MKKALFFGAQSLKSFLRQKLPKFVASIPLIWLTNISQSPIGNLILRPSWKRCPDCQVLIGAFMMAPCRGTHEQKHMGIFPFFWGGTFLRVILSFWREGHFCHHISTTLDIGITSHQTQNKSPYFFVFHPKKWWFCKQQTLFSEAKPPSVNGLFGSCPVSGLTMDCFMGVVT